MVPRDIQDALIDGWQRDFPLEPEPYARIARSLCVCELSLLGMLAGLSRSGTLSRVGAIVRPNTVGASTLAAIATPPERLEEVAAIVNAEPGVNHNYEREHSFNLWFVVTGADCEAVASTITRIEHQSGLPVLNLPLRTAYHIDLGFPLNGCRDTERSLDTRTCTGRITREDRLLLNAIEDGLPLVSRPYEAIALQIGSNEGAVIERLGNLLDRGIVKRLGLIVRHRKLGFTANAMVVWDIAADKVDQVGEKFAGQPFVTLCYRRDRRPPDWPYNLFCMIHGRSRSVVLGQIDELKGLAGETMPPMDILFSARAFKQRGARLSAA